MAHNYSNTASRATLDGTLNSNASTFAVASFTGYPASPFYILMDRDTSAAELMEVTGVAGSTLTVVRGAGGTAATSHSNGATIEHVIPAAVPQLVEQHTEATSNIHGVTGTLIGSTSSGTLANKTFRGAHTHVYSDTEPDSPAGGFVVTADNSVARDGFIANNTGANADRNAFVSRQSGSDRFNVFYDGTVKVTPSGAASRPAFETTGNVKAENFESTDDITAAGDITAQGTVSGSNVNAGNVNISGTLSSTANNTFGTVSAAGLIQANSAGTGLTVTNAAEIGSLTVTNGNTVLSGTNARLQLPASPTQSSPGTATGQVRYRAGSLEAWDGTKWRSQGGAAPVVSDSQGASGHINSNRARVAELTIPGFGTGVTYVIVAHGQCEINNVTTGRFDLACILDDWTTDAGQFGVGLGNGFTTTGMCVSSVLTGAHTVEFVIRDTVGAGECDLTAFNQRFVAVAIPTLAG